MRAMSPSPKRIDNKYSAAPRDNCSSPIWIRRARIAASVLELVTWELISPHLVNCAIARQSCHGKTDLALPQYLGALAEYSCDHQFRCDYRGPWRNLFSGDELSSAQKVT